MNEYRFLYCSVEICVLFSWFQVGIEPGTDGFQLLQTI